MHANIPLGKNFSLTRSDPNPEVSPLFTELTKKMHFFRFLQKEIASAKTEAEKEAVLGILTKTKIQIRALETEWKKAQKAMAQTVHAPLPGTRLH